MSNTILSGDFTVYYTNDPSGAGDKQIKWSGTTGMHSVKELYKELQDLFDNNTAGVGDHMAEGVPMSSQTPTEYTIGRIETSDNEPWFIDEETVKHLVGGAISTLAWARVQDSEIGIVRFTYTFGTNFITSDIGKTVVSSAADSGKLLDFHQTASGWEAHVRPDSFLAANNWDSNGVTVTVTGGSAASVTMSPSTTGENLWASIFSLGTIYDNTNMYVYQNHVQITPWWPSGHIDVLILIKEFNVTIDNGQLIVFARQYGVLYDHSLIDASAGGRNPVAISTSEDINNDTGYRQLTVSGVTGTFNAGNYIYFGASWAAATKKGVLTDVSGTTLTYYLIGDLTDFVDTNAITEWTGTANDATATVSGAPVNTSTGPANITGVTITFGATSQNVGDGAGSQPYDVAINCNGYTLSRIYEYLKYVSRRGSTADIDSGSQTVIGESYIAVGDIKINFDNETVANFSQGETVTAAGGISGVITSLVDNGTTGTMVLRDTRGTFVNDTVITGATSTAQAHVNGAPAAITIIRSTPFGTFAGGNFFGARGVWISNMHADDSNSYQLIDSNNVVRIPPATVGISVNNLVIGDAVSVFRATDQNGTINKSMFNIYDTHTAPQSVIRVEESIPSDTPTSGTIRVDRRSATGAILGETRYAYESWNNTNQPTYSTFVLNTVGPVTTTEDYGTNDAAYVPYIDIVATGTSASVSVQFVTTRNISTRVRKKGILPYRVDNVDLTASGYSATVVRTSDTIAE